MMVMMMMLLVVMLLLLKLLSAVELAYLYDLAIFSYSCVNLIIYSFLMDGILFYLCLFKVICYFLPQ